ncbi:DNA repair protein RecN [Salidesulfovibrio onnuriiensis]|uniref:DNA repair protein RecN n=1 Tax=Salidesulfovibrio onnuriiensis TaxID=2583823 RepID=UPI0011C93D13|nr:AAA family ATPase [Salidesulfovibrio onnuriiensis]
MLELLRIRNLALIEDAELEFSSGMNTLTGETGAGKSFILRAVDFIMGQSMDRNLVRPGAEKATVEALFVLPDGDCIIRRELSAETGRSRVFINDKLSSQDAVKELRPKLIIHTSQHGQQKLLSPAFQSEVLDTFLPDNSLLLAREAALDELRSVIKAIDELDRRCEDLVKQREFLEFQKKEIEKIDPQPGEEDLLEERKTVLKDRERAGECLRNALDCIHGDANLLDAMSLLSREMDIIARLYPEFEDDRQSVEDFRLKLHDLDSHLRRDPGEIESDYDDMTLDDVESRLFKISQLKRKLGRGLGDICGLYKQISDDLSFLDACDLDRTRLKKEEVEKAQNLSKVLDKLNKARKKAARELCLNIEGELGDLGFSEHVRVTYEFEPKEIHEGVTDYRGRLMWVPNPGQRPQPLDKIASGGELSRFLLALVSLRRGAGGEHLPTLIFDEVDAGIGGLTLNSVAAKLRELADRQQMLLITHWPQLAGRADRHFSIVKEVLDGQTYTRCDRLNNGEIREELSRMGGGGKQGDALADSLMKRS